MFVTISDNDVRLNRNDIRNLHWENISREDLKSSKFKDFAEMFVEMYNGKIFTYEIFNLLFNDLWNLHKLNK